MRPLVCVTARVPRHWPRALASMSPHGARRQRCAAGAALRGCGPVTGAGRVLGLRYAPDAQSLLVWRAMRIRAAGRAEVAWGRGCEAEEAVRSGGFNLGFGGRAAAAAARDTILGLGTRIARCMACRDRTAVRSARGVNP